MSPQQISHTDRNRNEAMTDIDHDNLNDSTTIPHNNREIGDVVVSNYAITDVVSNVPRTKELQISHTNMTKATNNIVFTNKCTSKNDTAALSPLPRENGCKVDTCDTNFPSTIELTALINYNRKKSNTIWAQKIQNRESHSHTLGVHNIILDEFMSHYGSKTIITQEDLRLHKWSNICHIIHLI